MASLSLRDRFFSPPVARAVTSPSGILAFGAGAAAGVLAVGLAPITVPVALATGALAYGARVALAIPRKGHGETIDVFAVQEPWRHAVQDAVVARKRFEQAVRSFEAGPVRDRVAGLMDQLDAAVQECWQVAKQGQLLVEARRSIDDRNAQRDLQRVTQSVAAGAQPNATQARTIESLRSQLASASRMDELIRTTKDELDLLNARLDETVSQALELAVTKRIGDVDPLRGELGDIVDDLSSLRLAVQDIDRTAPAEVPSAPSPQAEPPTSAPAPPPPTTSPPTSSPPTS